MEIHISCIYLPHTPNRIERKRSEEYLKYFDLSVVKRSFERYSYLEFILKKTRRKSARFYSWLRFFRDTSLSIQVFVNKHRCPFKCFIELYHLNSCLDCLSRSLSYRFSGCCFQSYLKIACRNTQNPTCTKGIWSLEVKCKRKWFWDLFPGSLVSAWQNSEVAKRTGDFRNYILKNVFKSFCSKLII